MPVAMPPASSDEREQLLSWLAFLRGAVLRKLEGLDEEQARWRPDGRLIPVLGVANHLTHVEWRWIDGGYLGAEVSRTEAEFVPGPELTVEQVRSRYLDRAAATESAVRGLALDAPCATKPGVDLRWVLLHLIHETARHAGHADATRELLDGTTGE